MLAFVSLPFLVQYTLGKSEVQTGLLMTPWPIMTAVVAPIAGRLADHYPAGILGALGLTIFAVGLALLGTMASHPSTLDIVWRMAVCGAGFGLFQSPNNRAIVISAPKERSGGQAECWGRHVSWGKRWERRWSLSSLRRLQASPVGSSTQASARHS